MLKTLAGFLIAIFASAALEAAPISYSVLVNTSSIAGVSGNIDYQFNPGAFTSDPAFVTISMFSSDGTLAGAPVLTGDVAGALPASVTIHNTFGFNDYSDGFTFGSVLSFRVRFDGTALTSPSPSATSGSTFAFSLFNADFSSALLSTDTVNGALVQGDVNLDGTVTITNFGVGHTTTVSPVPDGPPTVPEPATLLLVAGGFVAAVARRGRRGLRSF